jgi:hypothetical protein
MCMCMCVPWHAYVHVVYVVHVHVHEMCAMGIWHECACGVCVMRHEDAPSSKKVDQNR